MLEGMTAPCRGLTAYPGVSNDRPWAWDVCSCTISSDLRRCGIAGSTNPRSVSRYHVVVMNPTLMSYKVINDDVKVVFSWKSIIVCLKLIFLDYHFMTSRWWLVSQTYSALLRCDAVVKVVGGDVGLQTNWTCRLDTLPAPVAGYSILPRIAHRL